MKKVTAVLELSLVERVALQGTLSGYRPESREDERLCVRVWEWLDFDGLQEILSNCAPSSSSPSRIILPDNSKERVPFELPENGLRWLDVRLPPAPDISSARIINPLRERIKAALDSLSPAETPPGL